MSSRFLVIGCGSIGKRHIRNLTALNAGEILAFDVRRDRRTEVMSQFGIEAFDHLKEAWERRPEVALITAPTSMHVSLALEAAECGCHLFIEKPLSDNLQGVQQLVDAAKRRKLVTLVGCNMRFHPGVRTVKRLLEAGSIGRVVAARVEAGHYLPDWHPWEDYRHTYSARRTLGGGVILDAIHELDYLRWMLGEIEALVCFAGKLSHLEIETEDTAAMLVRFADGAIGEIHLDYVQRSYSRTCQVIGDEGTICWDYKAGAVRWYSAQAGKQQVFRDPSDWDSNQMYLDEMQHFLACLALEQEPALDVFEAARVLELALMAKASAETRRVVTLGG